MRSPLGWDGLRVYWSCSHCYATDGLLESVNFSGEIHLVTDDFGPACKMNSRECWLTGWWFNFAFKIFLIPWFRLVTFLATKSPLYQLCDQAGNNSINPTDWESTFPCNMCVNSQIYCCQRPEILYHWPKTWIKPAIKTEASIWALL